MEKYDPSHPPKEKTLLGGSEYHAKYANVQETWRKYGWLPKSERENGKTTANTKNN